MCTYELADSYDEGSPDNAPIVTSLYRRMDTGDYVDGPGPGVAMFAYRRCPPDGPARGPFWVPTAEAVDINALIAEASQRLRASAPMPALDMSPAPDVGTVFNLGLWLAVDDPGQLNVVAQVGPVWSSATARLTGMSWDMGGNEDASVVECAGLGTPYPDGSNSIEQGPCGFTYRRGTGPMTVEITATAHYDVRLTTSTGIDRAMEPISATYTFPYAVGEIVTVGTG